MCGVVDCLIAGDNLTSADVRKAVHLVKFNLDAACIPHDSPGPASITRYPELVGKLRITIDDVDDNACVPYIGNEVHISGFDIQGIIKEAKPWTPWFSGT